MLRDPRRLWVVVSLLSTWFAATAFAQSPPTSAVDAASPTWTLEEALTRARRSSPALGIAAARLDAARADLVHARTYPYNPEVMIEAAERSGSTESSTDRGVEVGQEIEIGGQRGKRIRAAEAALAAAESWFRRAGQELSHRVGLAFAQGLAEQRRVAIARTELALVEGLLSFEERRLEAGAGTQLDLNLARAATGRVRHRLQQDLAARAAAFVRLAEVVGADPTLPPESLVSAGEGLPGKLPPLAELVERALAARTDLAASRDILEAARLEIALQRSLALPNLRAGLFSRREEGDEITGATIGIAVPVFDRNQGGIARAEAEVASAVADLASGELAVRRSVADAVARYQAAADAIVALDALVVDTLEESLELLGRSLAAGKVSAGDVLVLRRELVEAQRQHVEAELAFATARADLRLAAGASVLPLRTPSSPTPGDF